MNLYITLIVTLPRSVHSYRPKRSRSCTSVFDSDPDFKYRIRQTKSMLAKKKKRIYEIEGAFLYKHGYQGLIL